MQRLYLLLLTSFLGLNAVELPADQPPFTIAMPRTFKPAMDYLRHIVTPDSPEYNEEDFHTALESMRQFMGHPEGCTKEQAYDFSNCWLMAKLRESHMDEINTLTELPECAQDRSIKIIATHLKTEVDINICPDYLKSNIACFVFLRDYKHFRGSILVLPKPLEKFVKVLGVVSMLGNCYSLHKARTEPDFLARGDGQIPTPDQFRAIYKSTKIRESEHELDWLGPFMLQGLDRYIRFED